MEQTVLNWLKNGTFVSIEWAVWELHRLDPIWFDEDGARQDILNAIKKYYASNT